MNTLQEMPATQGKTESANGNTRDRRTIVSFTRRSGKLDKRLARAWQAYADTYLLAVDSDPTSLGVDPKLDLDRAFFGRVFGRQARLTVEIGSGQGENIVAAAQKNPEQNFLALEVYEPGLAHTMLLAGKLGLTNLKVAKTNAPELMGALKPSTLDEVWTFFPDPWPKMKHHKRRLVQPALAADIARALEPGGLWRIATDIDDYALHVHEVMDQNRHYTNMGQKLVSLPVQHVGKGTAYEAKQLPHADFREAERFDGRILTNFERKGLTAGHTIHDFTYQRQA
ncbi:tRNA (guanine-N(7)-)-methyltransferase [Bombiscardovia nodaiensis]|uniref:tRNA (guanine-N(7)-)-methyltransferase n=1 Tax=Bombiscardovia nodaiensis TaxID=2932181 RepID=A0ABN6SCP0_9BIFI|nr:tRNA (guanine-N(7)-)-methyltransferase [Bombiscardovia nodaiensis]